MFSSVYHKGSLAIASNGLISLEGLTETTPHDLSTLISLRPNAHIALYLLLL